MTDWLAVLAIGFVLGMRHATDADHVLAVSTIVSKHRSIRHAAAIGAFWGLGHTLTILVVGGGIVLFGWVIPPRLGLSMEFSVGVMLVLLGAASVSSAFRNARGMMAGELAGEFRASTHRHGDYIHTHAQPPGAHPHPPDRTPVAWLDRRLGRLAIYRPARPLLVGMVHGLAGSAAVALLVLAAIGSPHWAFGYLLVFGAGTICGMMLVTVLIGEPFRWSGAHAGFGRALRFTAGALSVGLGLFLAWHTGIAGGLFGASPVWHPR